MDYVVFDLEWNQAESLSQKEALSFEIVEIGAVKLDKNCQIVDRFSSLVRPALYSKLNAATSQVIPITEEELQTQGRAFPEVVQEFLHWCGKEVRFCTWGIMDLAELQKNMEFYGLEERLPKPLYYYDIQKWYSIFYEDGKKRRSLEYAVESLALWDEMPFHRAFSDAYYTAKVMQTMDVEQMELYVSIDYHHLPRNRKEEIYRVFGNRYSKFVSRVFASREEALLCPPVTSMVCFQCRHAVPFRAKWFSQYGKNYYALGYCSEHGWLKGKIRFKKPDEGEGFFVVKTIKCVGEDEAKQILEKRNNLREKRKNRRQEEEKRE